MDKRWGGWYHSFRWKFFVSQCAKTSWGPSMFQKFRVSKNFAHKKGISLFYVDFFASQGQKNLPFEKILVSNIFIHRRGHHGFVETFLLHMTEKLQMRPCCVSEFFSFGKKFLDNRWGVYQVIPSKLFLSHSAEKICCVTLQCFRKFLVWEKIYGGEMGGIIFFRRNFLSHSAEKFRRGTL